MNLSSETNIYADFESICKKKQPDLSTIMSDETNVSPENVDSSSPEEVDKEALSLSTVPSSEPTITLSSSAPSMMDTFRTCGLSGGRIGKEELRWKLTMPQYLRHAMRDCIRYQDPTAMSRHINVKDDKGIDPPETPMVVFINTRTGGRHGPVLKERLKQLMSEEQVFDLSDVNPHEFLEYGLGCLEVLVSLGDS